MNKLFYLLISLLILVSCGGSKTVVGTENTTNQLLGDLNNVYIQLYNIENDQVKVIVDPQAFTTERTTFYFPKQVPGTYENNDYGQLIAGIKAFDYNGKELPIDQIDVNSWEISNAAKLDKVEYLVNDSFDEAGEYTIFSPAGTNIDADVNYVLNLNGFVGYFEGRLDSPYDIYVYRPQNMYGGSSLDQISEGKKTDSDFFVEDVFHADRYFQVTDNPIFYTLSQPEEFQLDEIEISLQVHSPNEIYSAEKLRPNIEKMMTAQKKYLGSINQTPRYSILTYLTKGEDDASGYGALEHHTSTVVVLPEAMPEDYLNETMTDVVSHEFFHTLTPLNVHSEEIHYFDYNDPKMSEHLWMYEGMTEYFANHFQIHEGLIDESTFLTKMMSKIVTADLFDDEMPFTVMSKNVLVEPYHEQYLNVYNKGALINMALDIRLRELSDGEYGVLKMMGELAQKYGPEKPFKDEELIPTIVDMTYPEIQDFFDTYVSGTTPIPYDDFFKKVGIEEVETEQSTYLIFDPETQSLFIRLDEEEGDIFIPEEAFQHSMWKKIGVVEGDIIKTVNGTAYSLDNIRDLAQLSMSLEDGESFSMEVERDGQILQLQTTYEKPVITSNELNFLDLPESDPRAKLRQAWLYN